MDASLRTNKPRKGSGVRSRGGGARRTTNFIKTVGRHTGLDAGLLLLQEAHEPEHHLDLADLVGSGVVLATRSNRQWEGILVATASNSGTPGAALRKVKDTNSPFQKLRENVFVPKNQIASCIPRQDRPPVQPQIIVDDLTLTLDSPPADPCDQFSPNSELIGTAASSKEVGISFIDRNAPDPKGKEPEGGDLAKDIGVKESRAKPDEEHIIGSFREFVENQRQSLAQTKKDIRNLKSEKDRREHRAGLVAFSRNFKLNKPIPEDLVPILTKDSEKAKQIVERSSQDVESAMARRIGEPQAGSGQLLEKLAVSMNPNPSETGTSNLPKMVIQAIPPFNPSIGFRLGLLPQSPGSFSAQAVDSRINPTSPVTYPTLTIPVGPVAQRDEIQAQNERGNSPDLEHVLSSTMSVEQITTLLCQHGYPDITTQLNLGECGKYPRVHGGAADIYCGRLYNGLKVAIKRSRARIPNDENGRTCLRVIAKEGYLWSKYRHPNILETHGVVRFHDGIALVAPWMENGTVMDYIRIHPDADRPKLCVEIASGVAYLHQVETTHGDLKGANVLISYDGVAQLNDFGSTSMTHHTLQFTGGTHSRTYTLRWAAPEILSDDGDMSAASDVYALGMTILEVVSGKQPFEYLRKEAAVSAALFRGDTPRRPEIYLPPTSTQGDRLWGLLQLCWKANPQDRPSAQDAVEVLSLITPEGLRA